MFRDRLYKIRKMAAVAKKWLQGRSQGGKDNVSRDMKRVEVSSRVLGISEFRLFQLSYARWYGSEMPEKSMEYVFSDYMFNGDVPHWVRHFARTVLSHFFSGTLNPREFDIECAARFQTGESKSSDWVSMAVCFALFLIVSGRIAFH